MGFLGGLFSVGGTLALDALGALVSGSTKNANNLANKSFRSDAYGTPISRCRGTVRVQGKVWDMSKIRTTIRKTSGGGLFGIGQKTVRYNLYSASIFIGFAEKLGGGAAARCLRLWADGKLLYNGIASDVSITGAVTVTVVAGGQQPGSFNLLVDLASGAHLKLNPTDLITVPGDPQPYEVQSPIDVSGPKLGFPLPVWPPLRNALAGGGALTLPGINSPVWDLSSFDPDPHDGSHDAGGYDAPPGGATFYLGADDQQPDPSLVKVYGAGNVPGYRGRCAVMLRDLQLRNYGDRPPEITGLWAFDTVTGQFPVIGPYAVPVLHSLFSMATPFSGTSSLAFTNPLENPLSYLFAFINVGGIGGGDKMLVRINTQTNLYEAQADLTTLIGGGIWVGPVVDSDGYVYMNSSNGFGGSWGNVKFDGRTLALVAAVTSGLTDPSGISLWDTQQSLFGNPVKVKGFVLMGTFGGIEFYDRNTLQPFGVANPASLGTVCIGYDKNGNPIITAGDSAGPGTPYGGSGAEMAGDAFCVDAEGNVWGGQKDTLSKYDGQFISSINIPALLQGQLQQYLAQPGFARTDYSVSAVSSFFVRALYYNAADNSIIVFGDGGVGKWDIATSSLIATAAVTDTPVSEFIDLNGTILLSGLKRFDVNTMQVVATYNLGSWTAGGSPAGGGSDPMLYDELTDSVFFRQFSDGKIYRAFLDRGTGDGVGLDSVVASMAEEIYGSSEFDVTQLTTAGQTVSGVEFTHEPRKDSLDMLGKFYQFDRTEIDGKIVFVPRGNPAAVEIPEDDLGSLDDPSKYEPRLAESVQDEYTLPLLVRVHYYDPLKQWQQCTQEAKRNSQPYPSSLAGGKTIISTAQQRDITVPITENATLIKQQALKLLWEEWARAAERKGNLPYGGSSTIAYWRLDPSDVVNYNYKGKLLETMLEELDIGAGLALQASGRSQDRSVFDATFLPASSAGQGSGTPATQPPLANDNYTINPVDPLSSPNSTTIDMAAFVASFTSGLRTAYVARVFTVTDPGAGNTAIYYVTIPDPDFTGDQPPGTASLVPIVSTDPTVAHVGETGFINAGAITVLGSGATTTTPNPLPGGQPSPNSGELVAEVAFGPTQQADVDGFKVAHGLGVIPSNVQIQIVQGSPPIVGDVWFQQLRYDAEFVYLVASAAGITGYLEIWD